MKRLRSCVTTSVIIVVRLFVIAGQWILEVERPTTSPTSMPVTKWRIRFKALVIGVNTATILPAFAAMGKMFL